MTRSISQNRYYRGVVCANIAIRLGIPQAKAHEMLKGKFLAEPVVAGEKIVGYVSGTTSSLDTASFEEYLSRCRQWASESLGLFIEKPNERDVG